MKQVSEAANQQEITLPVGEDLELRLDENPTTGYRWVVESSPDPVGELVEDAFEPAGGRPGQGGSHRWLFRAKQVGRGKIKLSYRRPWEQPPAARTFSLTLHVTV